MGKKKVVVGMSGGVDSSVAAWLLLKQGYQVLGVTMQIWQDEALEQMEENGGCCGLSAVDDARQAASHLGIAHYVMNFKKDFKEKVIDYFMDEYLCGRTPNPCIACNRYIKWESLLKRSSDIGADYIATGHYARIERLANGRYALRKSAASAKDQTYALYNLTQEQLSRTLFPAGDYTKEEIRAFAEELGLQTAHKPDSQEICFVPDGDYAAFLETETNETEQPGNFVDLDGKILGVHKGISHYTIGQRKGLGIAFGEPVFVVEIRPETREVVLGRAKDVFADTLLASNLCYMAADSFAGLHQVTAKIRYNHEGTPAIVCGVKDGILKLSFPEPVRAVTPGQAVVLYDGEHVLGGGTICR